MTAQKETSLVPLLRTLWSYLQFVMTCSPAIAIFGLWNVSIYAYQIDIKCLLLISSWAQAFFTMTFNTRFIKVWLESMTGMDHNSMSISFINSKVDVPKFFFFIWFIPQTTQMLSRIPSHYMRVMVTKRECIIQQIHNVR